MQAFFGHDVIEMILNAGMMAKFVLIVLLIFSIISWAIIFMKSRTLSKIKTETEDFLKLFWGERDLKELYSESKDMEYSPIAWLFKEGYEELNRIKKIYNNDKIQGHIIEELERSLKKVMIDQINQLGYGMGFLATTGNTTPFIGLFGTVWGIMEAFRSIGLKGSASLAVVAPGISEALITTAAGLAAAIPAVIAFNYFNNKISALRGEMEIFISDFLNLIERYFLKSLSHSEKEEKRLETEDE